MLASDIGSGMIGRVMASLGTIRMIDADRASAGNRNARGCRASGMVVHGTATGPMDASPLDILP